MIALKLKDAFYDTFTVDYFYCVSYLPQHVPENKFAVWFRSTVRSRGTVKTIYIVWGIRRAVGPDLKIELEFELELEFEFEFEFELEFEL